MSTECTAAGRELARSMIDSTDDYAFTALGEMTAAEIPIIEHLIMLIDKRRPGSKSDLRDAAISRVRALRAEGDLLDMPRHLRNPQNLATEDASLHRALGAISVAIIKMAYIEGWADRDLRPAGSGTAAEDWEYSQTLSTLRAGGLVKR